MRYGICLARLSPTKPSFSIDYHRSISRMEAEMLQKSMETEMSKCMKEYEDEQTRKKVDLFAFLPDDILLDIFKRFPEAFVRYKAKYVCRRWFNIITNSILLSHASFILQNIQSLQTRLVDIREEEEEEKGLQVKEQYLDIFRIGMIRSWCNEFLLISDSRHSLYVYNLITKKGSYLPQCNASCGGYYTSGKCGVALSCDGFKGIYTVSHLFIGLRTIECQILRRDENHAITHTLSKWKKLQVPYKNGRQYIWGDPVTVQGRYLNWMIHSSNHLVSVDTVKEELHIISLPVPGSKNQEEYVNSIFVMGGSLALMKRVSWDKAEIWLLKDFHRVKWDKVQSISDGNRHFDRYLGKIITHRIYGVINKRYIISKAGGDMYSYDLKSGVQKILDIYIQYAQFQSDESCVVHSIAPCIK